MIRTSTYPPKFPLPAMGGYRYFFNGQEADNEVLGDGALHAFKYRMHDTRIGRFWSVDPLAGDYPYWSTYQFAGLMPTWYGELEGLEPIARPARTVRRPAIGLRQYNYARIEDVRMPSLRTTTTYTYRIGTPTGYRQSVSTPVGQYIYTYNSPQGNNIPMSSDNWLAKAMTLVGDGCQIYTQRIEDNLNTPSGYRKSYKIQVKFIDYRYQYRFDLTQLEYENQFRRVLNELPDSEMELPAGTPPSWQKFWEDSEKAGRAMKIMGPSPQDYIDRILLLGNKTLLDSNVKTENVPEIRPTEP